jgi:Fungal specific transcription factor domain
MLWEKDSIDYSSPEYELNLSFQDCFLPDNIDWLDKFQYKPCLENQNISVPLLTPNETSLVHGSNVQRSILSRPGSPLLTHFNGHVGNTSTSSTAVTIVPITEERGQAMQAEVDNLCPTCTLPTRRTLSSYVQRYFKSFHRHQPFLHESTWSQEEAPTYLLLAVCANGALYSLDRATAVDLCRASMATMGTGDGSIATLQCMMLLTAFCAWEGGAENIRLAMQLSSQANIELRRAWSVERGGHGQSQLDWALWRKTEMLKRQVLFKLRLLRS